MDQNARRYIGRRGFLWYAENLIFYPCAFSFITLFPVLLTWTLNSEGYQSSYHYYPWITISSGSIGLLFGAFRIVAERRSRTLTKEQLDAEIAHVSAALVELDKSLEAAERLKGLRKAIGVKPWILLPLSDLNDTRREVYAEMRQKILRYK